MVISYIETIKIIKITVDVIIAFASDVYIDITGFTNISPIECENVFIVVSPFLDWKSLNAIF